MFHTLYLGLLLCVAGSQALYDSSSDVVELTPANFDNLVTNSNEVWIVEFYAPWCGHCKNLVPEYKKAASALKGIIKVGAVDADQHKSLSGKYGVKGFPTIKIFTGSKHTPYQGQRTADAFVDAGIKAAKDRAYENLGKKSGGGSDKQTLFGHNIPWKKIQKTVLRLRNYTHKKRTSLKNQKTDMISLKAGVWKPLLSSSKNRPQKPLLSYREPQSKKPLLSFLKPPTKKPLLSFRKPHIKEPLLSFRDPQHSEAVGFFDLDHLQDQLFHINDNKQHRRPINKKANLHTASVQRSKSSKAFVVPGNNIDKPGSIRDSAQEQQLKRVLRNSSKRHSKLVMHKQPKKKGGLKRQLRKKNLSKKSLQKNFRKKNNFNNSN